MMTRVGNAINSGVARMSHHKRGFHATGTTGVFGAAMTAARLLGLNKDQVMDAMGIAGSYACGLLESVTTPRADVWKTHPGIAGQNGISSGILAQVGLKGPPTVLEGKSGFFSAFGGENVDWGKMEQDLGKRFLIMDSAFKLHNCPHVWANPLDSLSRLKKTYAFKPEDVTEIKIMIPTMYTYVLYSSQGKIYPKDYGEAESNPAYVMAAMMIHGRASIEQFKDSVLADPKMKEMASKITVEVDPSLDKIFQGTDRSPAQVRVILKNNRKELVDTADYPRGSPQNPATQGEMEEKFVHAAGVVLEKERALEIARFTSKMEQQRDLRDLVKNLIV